MGTVGGESCSHKNGGPSNVNVELLSPTGGIASSVLTSTDGSYSFTNIIPGLKLPCHLTKDHCIHVMQKVSSMRNSFNHQFVLCQYVMHNTRG